MGPEEPGAGSTALVIGSKRDRRTFCLGHLATAERTAAVVLPPDPGTVIEGYERLGGEAPLTVVLDEATGTPPTDVAGVHTTTVDAGSLPSVGEAALGTIETDGTDPSADRLWVAGLPDLLERASVQQVYRLLYILSERVRRVDGLGLYELSESTERKTVRILRQALDYEITLDPDPTPGPGHSPNRLPGYDRPREGTPEAKFHEAVGLLEDWSPDPEDRGVEVSWGPRRTTDHRIGVGDPGAATEAGVIRDRKHPLSFRDDWTEDGSR